MPKLAEWADPIGLLRVIPMERAVDKDAECKQDEGAKNPHRRVNPRSDRSPSHRSGIANHLQVGVYHKISISDWDRDPNLPLSGNGAGLAIQ